MSSDHSHGIGVLEDLRGPSKSLRTAIPDVYAGFSATHSAALAAGVLDAKTKELKIDTGDELVKGTLLTMGGEVVHDAFKAAA